MTRARFVAVAALVAWPALLPAQTPRPRIIAGAEFYGVSFDPGLGAKSVSEIVAPLGVAIPVGPRFAFDAGTYLVSATRKAETGETATISGLTDLTLRAGYQLVPDAVALTVSVNLPTGQSSLDADQVLVAGATATDLVPFPVTSFGSGFNVTSGAAVAVPVGGWALGAAGSFRFNGDYQPSADTSVTLTPGAEYRLRLGMDRVVGQGRVSFGVTFSTFSRDEFGVDQVNGGQRLITQGSWSFPVGNANVALYLWDINRTSDSTAAASCPFASCAQAKENTVALGATASVRTGRHTLRPALEYRRSWRGETALAPYGSLVSIGARYFLQASDRFTVIPGLRLDVGSITGVGLTGFSGSLTVRANL
jgi:hypothetical protein